MSEPDVGIRAVTLSDEHLMRELTRLHDTRHDAFLHGPTAALQNHSQRTVELESEYLRRHPEREIEPR